MAAAAALLGAFTRSLARAGVDNPGTIAVALSGGPDSLALAALAAQWSLAWQVAAADCSAPGPPRAVALIVDHRLREESAAEAAEVAGAAARLGLQPHVLQVDWAGGTPRLQDKMAAARSARYQLLLDACARLGRNHLLVAHHADDQAETFLLRFLHASGIQGLGCMPLVSTALSGCSGVAVVRPLLDVHKRELEAYCRGEGLPYVVDPTNADLAFARNCIRHLLQLQEELEQQQQQQEQQQPVAAAGSASLPPGHADEPGWPVRCSSGGIVEDVLRVQQACAEAAEEQQAAMHMLLQQGVLLMAGEQLPPLLQDPMGTPAASGAKAPAVGMEVLASLRARLEGELPAGTRFAVCSVPRLCSGDATEPVRDAALAWVLGAVSGRKHTVSAREGRALGRLMAGGRLAGRYTGGGCYVHPVPRSRGALCTVVPLEQQVAVTKALQGALH